MPEKVSKSGKKREQKKDAKKESAKESNKEAKPTILSIDFWTDGPGFYAVVLVLFALVFVWGSWNINKIVESTAPSVVPSVNQTVNERIDTRFYVVGVMRYPVWANVSEKQNKSERVRIGVNNDRDKLHYGLLPLYSSSEKRLEVGNPTRIEVLVVTRKYGNASEYLEVVPERILLGGGENTTIVARFNCENPGYYEGEIDIVVLVPKSMLAQVFSRVYTWLW